MPRLVPMTEEEKKIREECRERLHEWITSPEFDAEMEESLAQVREVCERMRKESEVNWQTLLEPFTI